jgi:hypothetical protein
MDNKFTSHTIKSIRNELILNNDEEEIKAIKQRFLNKIKLTNNDIDTGIYIAEMWNVISKLYVCKKRKISSN